MSLGMHICLELHEPSLIIGDVVLSLERSVDYSIGGRGK